MSDSIIGSWGTGFNNPFEESDWIFVTFYANGTYIHWQSDEPSNPDDQGGGVEYGSYTYDSNTGVISANSIVDENGDIGLTEFGTPTSFSISIDSDILSIEGEPATFERVVDESNLLVGSWGTGQNNTGEEAEWIGVTFYPNGYYIHLQSDEPSNFDDQGGGVEYGTYTYNPSTGIVTVNSIIDNNGDVGLTEFGAPASFSVSLTSNTVSIVGETISYARVVDGLLQGTNFDEEIIGTSSGDTIVSLAGNDTLRGGAGADSMEGSLGNDTYYVDNAGDIVAELVSQGADSVHSIISYTLPINVEDIYLSGTASIDATGNTLDNSLSGNSASNTLSGLAGNDTLRGDAGNDTLIGGVGVDTMEGGIGNDTYLVDNASDTVTELFDQGIDSVRSTISYALVANVEHVQLEGLSAIDATGNTLANILIGNSASNMLIGLAGDDSLDGAEGADTMEGGIGNDTYDVDNAGDLITELVSQGSDTVHSLISYTLPTNVENIYLSGSSSIDATGNTLSNLVHGNSASNALSGLAGDDMLSGGAGDDTLTGGAGGDSMEGGEGNDTYYVDNAADLVTELFDQGTDSIYSQVSYVLPGNVEAIFLSGAASIDGTGNILGNSLYGNSASNTLSGLAGDDLLYGGDDHDVLNGDTGNDILHGEGGNDSLNGDAGNDILVGGEGSDIIYGGEGFDAFFFNAPLNESTNVDVIKDYDYLSAHDLIYLHDDIFTSLGEVSEITQLSSENFHLGTSAQDANDYILYDSSSGTLSYDADGNGTSVAPIAFAQVESGPSSVHPLLSHHDIVVTNDIGLILIGTDLDDELSGGLANDSLIGLAGNDTLIGGGGDDTMIGGLDDDIYHVDSQGDSVSELADEGTDKVIATIDYVLVSNVENLDLGSGATSGTGNSLDNIINGNTASNILDGKAGADSMAGGSGADTYYVDNTGDQVIETDNTPEGTSGFRLGVDVSSTIDDVIASVDYTLGAYVENLELTGSATDATGNSLDNELTGNDANNSLSGLGGNDTLTGGLGNDTLDGGEGTDIAIFSGLAAAYSITEGDSQTTVSGADGTDVLISIENLQFDDQTLSLVPITGTAGDDTLSGTTSSETLYGRGGNDTLDGGLGSDRLVGNLGADSLLGGAGDDTLDGGLGNDTLDGGDDVDTAFYGFAQSSNQTGVTVDLTKTAAQNTVLVGFDTLLNIENIDGSQFNDTLIGNGANNVLSGAQGEDSLVGNLGADTLYGRAQNDTLVGGVGDDRLIGNIRADYLSGGSGNDTLDGGLGHDTLDGGLGTRDRAFYGFAQSSNASGVTVDLRLTTAQNTQLAGFDTLVNIEQVQGGRFNDTLIGNGENNVLRGMQGHDTLIGNLGNDILQGGIGRDVLSGGVGNDVFDAGWGLDTVTGGLGADTFVYQTPEQGADNITDFSAAQGDTFQFMSANFGDITTGVLASNYFTANASGLALDADDYFIFNTSSNVLRYDADGSGAGAPVNLALITNAAVLKHTDIVIA